MPNSSRLFVKPFIGGINTELSSVEDVILYTADELNCTILPEGMRGRRLGFNIERDGVWSTAEPSTSYTGFHWKNVNNIGLDVIVQQVNTKLFFYNITGKPISATDRMGSFDRVLFTNSVPAGIADDRGYMGFLDISDHVISSVNNEIEPLKYAAGSGYLFATSSSIKPLKISYRAGQFTAEPFTLKIRDLAGIEDGLKIDEMPPANPENLELLEDLDIKHFYNLLNQGWKEDDILQFARDKTKYPSNNLQWFLGKDDSGNYNTEKLLQKYFGNTPAPRGHFILDYDTLSRADASGLYGVEPTIWSFKKDAGRYIKNRKLRVKRSLWDVEQIYSLDDERVLKRLTFKWDRLERKSAKKSHDSKWSGKITYQIYGLNPLTNEYENIHTESEVAYGADPSYVYTISFNLTENDIQYKNYKIKTTFDRDSNGTSDIKHPIEISASILLFFEGDRNIDDWSKENIRGINTPVDITSMSGRMFYLVNDTVLFSQVITETGEEFFKCYQDADPTSEELSDIVATDGGYVKFNAMGVGRALQSFNRGVLVFGENVVYGLISPANKTFSASEYDIIELSRAGIIGKRSAVSTDDMVYYWSPLGIFRIGINPQTGSSLIAESITHTTIQEWYDRIPDESKKTCRGCYDFVNNRIYWYYAQPDKDEPTEQDMIRLNRCLVLDLTHNAFMPFKIDSEDGGVVDAFSVPTAYEVSPTLFVRVNGEKVVANEQNIIAVEEDEEFKRWTSIQHVIVNKENETAFGDYNNREFKDFDKHEYDSYMISRPIMFEGYSAYGNSINTTHTDKQVPVLQTLFKRTEQASLTPIIEPVEHLYNLKDAISYAEEWPTYDITSGTLSRHSVAYAYIFGDEGKLKSCKLRIDVKDFKGKNIDLGVEITGAEEKVIYNKLVTEDFIDIEIDTPSSSEAYKNCIIRVVAEIRGGEVSEEKVHFTADLVRDRTKPMLPIFTGMKETVLENTESMHSNELLVNLPKAVVTGLEIEAIPTLTTDTDWRFGWSCSTDVDSDMFSESAQYDIVEYGVSKKDSPTEKAYIQSLSLDKLAKVFKIGINTYNVSEDEVTAFKVRYKLGLLVPEYKDAKPVKSKVNYIAASGANIRMRWGWSLNDRSNRWDMVQNGYRPQKDFLHDEYVESRIHVRGRGKAFQVEIRNDGNKDFRLAGMNLVVRSK